MRQFPIENRAGLPAVPADSFGCEFRRGMAVVSVGTDGSGSRGWDGELMRYLKVSGAAMAVVSGAILAGCNRLPATIELRLPQGYVGNVYFKLDANGRDVWQRGGRYVYVVPESGVLPVKSLAPFFRPYRLVAKYPDGTVLPEGGLSAADDVAVRDSDNIENRRIRIYIGPEKMTQQ